jgi:cyclic beta-1,2-glucan synthetase
MGGGDWNDGMNRIGTEGRGESVWLTWFLSDVLERWTEVAQKSGHGQEAERYHALALHFARQADRAWDGAWYLRGYDDEGRPFGGSGSAECAIDSVVQSWSAFAPNENQHRCQTAVTSALECLWDRSSGTVALLSPPFGGLTDPGYIRNYPPGVRENGGQYTHGAVWLARACYRMGRSQEGYELLHTLLPETHDHRRYLAEPYVVAGDVSMADGQLGRGGWSWYTGAAAWFHRVVREELLGLTLREGVLHLQPKLPDHWSGCRMIWRLPWVELEITVERGAVPGILLDDIPATGALDCRQLEGRHRILVTLPR